MGEVRAAYTELRFFGKIDEPSRYRRRRSTSAGAPETTPHLIDSAWRLLCLWMIKEVVLRGKKKRKKHAVYDLSPDLWVFFIVRLNLTGKRKKKKCLSSLSISCIKDGSANTNLRAAYPPVIVYWLNRRATVSICECVELGILRCVRVYVISESVLLLLHVPSCICAPMYPSKVSREN